uniref:NADH dehydrogenase subunit 2 n=1 Tax=Docophoroides brevis TaxID=160119 RepID=UPI00211DAD47|nr:NADH dehydrogenase subunit 2 [Docophoroides brevis]UTT72582.1 NADH dehydrogenase subunit 2 [Docophoroides brevis]
MYLLFTIISIMMVLSSESLFLCWLCLEIMTISFIPFILWHNCNQYLKVSAWTYFVVQAVGSGMFLILSQMEDISMISFDSDFMSCFCMILMFMCLFMKMGMPPFHQWLVNLSEGLNWYSYYVLNVLQKLGPILIIYKMSMGMNDSLVYLCMLVAISSMLGMFNYSIRSFLVFSSVINISWVIMGSTTDKIACLMMLTNYSLLMMLIMIILSHNRISEFSSIGYSFKGTLSSEFVFLLSVLSLAGVPPMGGFIFKFHIVLHCVYWGITFSTLILLLTSVMFLMMYIYISQCIITKHKSPMVLNYYKPMNICSLLFCSQFFMPVMYFF